MKEFLCKNVMPNGLSCRGCYLQIEHLSEEGWTPKRCIISGRPQEWEEVFNFTRVPVVNGSAALFQTEKNVEAKK